MDKKPLISIITINYKQAEVTNQLLASLQNISWSNIEIIVVDNNSGIKSTSAININYSNVKLIINEENLGFAGGNNTGLRYAKGDYILFLNNDTEVAPGFIEPMIKLFKKHPQIGAVSPKIKFFHHPEIIQYAGFTPMNPFTQRINAIGNKQFDNGDYDKSGETNFAHGCAMMVSRAVIKKVGPMPDKYFLYYEEHDWSTKIKKSGYKIYYQGKSVVYHKESVSVQKNSPLKTYFLTRNRILYMRRNFNLLHKIISTLYILLFSIPKNTVIYIRKKEHAQLNAYWDAIIWNISQKTKEQWKF